MVRNPNPAPGECFVNEAKANGIIRVHTLRVVLASISSGASAGVVATLASFCHLINGAAEPHLLCAAGSAHSPPPTVDTDFKSTNQSSERNAMHHPTIRAFYRKSILVGPVIDSR